MKLVEIINSNSVWYQLCHPLYLAVCRVQRLGGEVISSVMVRVVGGKMSIVIHLHIAFLCIPTVHD